MVGSSKSTEPSSCLNEALICYVEQHLLLLKYSLLFDPKLLIVMLKSDFVIIAIIDYILIRVVLLFTAPCCCSKLLINKIIKR